MRIRFASLTDELYDAYIARAISRYAEEGAHATGIEPAAALTRARTQIEGLLPDGHRTAGQRLLQILDDQGENVGTLWYATDVETPPSKLFLYDIVIAGAERGRGLGTAALYALEDEARRLGAAEIALHVFTANANAIRLYERLGYHVTHAGEGGQQMTKAIAPTAR